MKRIQRKKVRLKRILINKNEYDFIFIDETEANKIVANNNVSDDVKFELAPYKWYELYWLRPKKLSDRQWDILKIFISAILGFITALIVQLIKCN